MNDFLERDILDKNRTFLPVIRFRSTISNSWLYRFARGRF